MRRLLLMVVIFSTFLSCTSCRKEAPVGPTSSVTLSIKTVFGQEPFIAGESYAYPSAGEIKFDELGFFLSDISLITENGTDAVTLEDITYLNIADIQDDASSADKGWIKVYYRVPLGVYKGIRFGLGVSHEENSQAPKDFAESNPLGVAERYSGQYFSYIFENVSGQYDDGDTSVFSINIVQDKMYKEVTLSNDFEITSSGKEIKLTFDLEKMFQRNDSILDLTQYPLILSPALPQMEWLSKNLEDSFSF